MDGPIYLSIIGEIFMAINSSISGKRVSSWDGVESPPLKKPHSLTTLPLVFEIQEIFEKIALSLSYATIVCLREVSHRSKEGADLALENRSFLGKIFFGAMQHLGIENEEFLQREIDLNCNILSDVRRPISIHEELSGPQVNSVFFGNYVAVRYEKDGRPVFACAKTDEHKEPLIWDFFVVDGIRPQYCKPFPASTTLFFPQKEGFIISKKNGQQLDYYLLDAAQKNYRCQPLSDQDLQIFPIERGIYRDRKFLKVYEKGEKWALCQMNFSSKEVKEELLYLDSEMAQLLKGVVAVRGRPFFVNFHATSTGLFILTRNGFTEKVYCVYLEKEGIKKRREGGAEASFFHSSWREIPIEVPYKEDRHCTLLLHDATLMVIRLQNSATQAVGEYVCSVESWSGKEVCKKETTLKLPPLSQFTKFISNIGKTILLFAYTEKELSLIFYDTEENSVKEKVVSSKDPIKEVSSLFLENSRLVVSLLVEKSCGNKALSRRRDTYVLTLLPIFREKRLPESMYYERGVGASWDGTPTGYTLRFESFHPK